MIEVSNVTKIYGERNAVDNISFEVAKGEIVGFLGPNGAGKSTTMKIITSFMPATFGTAKVAGFDVFTQANDVKRSVGYLPETPPVYLEMRVRDYIEFAAQLNEVPKNKLKAATDQTLEKTGLTSVQHRLIGNLSKGFRQRVGIAQALVHDPKVVILDEPTVGLDPRQIIEIRELIKGLGKDHTVILSTHILPEVTETCNRVIIINQGKIVKQDTLSSLTGQNKFALKARKLTEKAKQAIRKISGVESVTEAGDRLIIETSAKSTENRPEIIRAAVESGLDVFEFSAGRVNLEDVFLKLITTDTGSQA